MLHLLKGLRLKDLHRKDLHHKDRLLLHRPRQMKSMKTTICQDTKKKRK